MSKDGFTLVTRKHKLCVKSRYRKVNGLSIDFFDLDRGFDDLTKIPKLISKISNEPFAKKFMESFLDNLSQRLPVIGSNTGSAKLDLIIYGIGNFSRTFSAAAQLAFISYVKDQLYSRYTIRTFIFDPILTDNEKIFLRERDFEVLEENERGFRQIDTTTLFYMPHCPHSLINNVLYSNWDENCLRLLYILGNSFKEYSSNIRGHKYLLAANICTEVELGPFENRDDWFIPFSFTSLHYFNENVILPFPRDTEKPCYDDTIETI